MIHKIKNGQPCQVMGKSVGILVQNQSTKLNTPYVYRAITATSTNAVVSNFGHIYLKVNETKTVGEATYYKAQILAEVTGVPTIVWCDHDEYAKDNSLYIIEEVEGVETATLYGIIRRIPTLSGTMRVKEEDGTVYSLADDTMYYTANNYAVGAYIYNDQDEVDGYISATVSEIEDSLSQATLAATSSWNEMKQWNGTLETGSREVSVWTRNINVKENDPVYCLKNSTDLDVAEATNSTAPAVNATLSISYDGFTYLSEATITGSNSEVNYKLTDVPRGTFLKLASSSSLEATVLD